MRHLIHLLLAGLLLSPALAQTPPIRIMPLGDSITDGSAWDSPDGSGGYRGVLYNSLTTAGYNVDYIGSQTVNSSLLVEKNHEGHGGWNIGQIDSNIEGWLNTMDDPDVVLMLIGTNDTDTMATFGTAIDRLDALILKIATLRPYCHIIVSNLLVRNDLAARDTAIQAQFNPFVQPRVNAHVAAGRRVSFVDLRSVVALSDMPDLVHPNQTGYNNMAAAWLPAIQAVIGVNGDDAAPAIARARGTTDLTHVNVTLSMISCLFTYFPANPVSLQFSTPERAAESILASLRIQERLSHEFPERFILISYDDFTASRQLPLDRLPAPSDRSEFPQLFPGDKTCAS